MTSISKTVSELIATYYDRRFVQAFEQVDVEIVTTDDGSATITGALKEYFPDLDKALSSTDAADEQIVIGIETADGNRLGCLARGTWLLILVVTICLVLGLMMFGQETVITILKTIVSAYRG